MASGRRKSLRLPGLIVIGAQKCGTTSLYRYLAVHPEICMSTVKEPKFFIWHFERGLEWYASLFAEDARVYGEASTDYTVYPLGPSVPPRIRAVVPEVRLIYLVRDPVDRLVSQYLHNRAKGIAPRSAEALFRDPRLRENDLVYRGLYALQLEQYLAHFPMEQMLVIDQQELKEQRDEVLERVFRFVGVDNEFRAAEFSRLHLESRNRRRPRWAIRKSPRLAAVAAKARNLPVRVPEVFLTQPLSRPVLSTEVRERLGDYFREDAARLRELTGLELRHWCV